MHPDVRSSDYLIQRDLICCAQLSPQRSKFPNFFRTSGTPSLLLILCSSINYSVSNTLFKNTFLISHLSPLPRGDVSSTERWESFIIHCSLDYSFVNFLNTNICICEMLFFRERPFPEGFCLLPLKCASSVKADTVSSRYVHN